MATVQEVNIEILHQEEESNTLAHPSPSKDAVQVEFDPCIRCAWATLTSHRRYSVVDRPKFFDAAVTPRLLFASGTWALTEEMKKELQKTQKKNVEDGTTDEKKDLRAITSSAPRTSTPTPTTNPTVANQREDHLPRPSDQQETHQTVTANPSFACVSQDDKAKTKRQSLPVDCTVRATHKAVDLMAAHGIKPRILAQSKKNWKQTRIAKHHNDRWTKAHCKVEFSEIDQPERVLETRTISPNLKHGINFYQQPDVCNENNDFANDMTRLAATQNGLTWDSMESDSMDSRHPQQRHTCHEQPKHIRTE